MLKNLRACNEVNGKSMDGCAHASKGHAQRHQFKNARGKIYQRRALRSHQIVVNNEIMERKPNIFKINKWILYSG